MPAPRLPPEVIGIILSYAAPRLPTKFLKPYLRLRSRFAALAVVSRDWYYAILPCLYEEVAIIIRDGKKFCLQQAIERHHALVRTIIIDSIDSDAEIPREIIQDDLMRTMVLRFFEICPQLHNVVVNGWSINFVIYPNMKKKNFWSMPPYVQIPTGSIRRFTLRMESGIRGCAQGLIDGMRDFKSSLRDLEVHSLRSEDFEKPLHGSKIPRIPTLERIALYGGRPCWKDVVWIIGSARTNTGAPTLRELVLMDVETLGDQEIINLLSKWSLGEHLRSIQIQSHSKCKKVCPSSILELCPSLEHFSCTSPVPLETFTPLPSTLCSLEIVDSMFVTPNQLLAGIEKGWFDGLEVLYLLFTGNRVASLGWDWAHASIQKACIAHGTRFMVKYSVCNV